MSDPKGSPTAQNFWRNFVADMEAIAQRVTPFFAAVGDVTNGLVRIVKRGETYDPTSAQLMQLSQLPVSVNRPVMVMQLADGSQVVLGNIQSGPEAVPSVSDPNAQSYNTADTTSTTDTVNYSALIHVTYSNLRAGTYKAVTKGGAIFSHSTANANVNMRVNAVVSSPSASFTSTADTPKVHATANTEMRLEHGAPVTGIVVAEGAQVTVYIEYKCSTAGTASVRNASQFCDLVRTGD